MRVAAPWEANRYFDVPKETSFALTGNSPIQVAKANPMRVCLILGVPGVSTGGVNFSTNASINSNQQGINVTPTSGPLTLLHSEVGSLVSYDWYAIGSAAGQYATVIEVVLHDWPADDPDDTGDVRDYIDKLAQQIRLLTATLQPSEA